MSVFFNKFRLLCSPSVDSHFISCCQLHWEGVGRDVYAPKHGQQPSIFPTHDHSKLCLYKCTTKLQSDKSITLLPLPLLFRNKMKYIFYRCIDIILYSVLQYYNGRPYSLQTLCFSVTPLVYCSLFSFLQNSLQMELCSQWTAVHCDLFLALRLM